MSASTGAGRRVESLVLLSGVVVLLALRLPFLPATLEDIDSVNFDLGVHDYDLVHHQPHPPGFPVYIFLARLAHPWFDSHAAGLAFLSALFGALVVVPLYFLMRRLTSRQEAGLVCVLTLFNPIVWFNSVRPMSDLTGFFLVTTAQWLLVSALDDEPPLVRRRAFWLLGVALAGVSIGARLQAVWLVGPVLLYGLWRRRSIQTAAETLVCFGAAVALWAVPLLMLSGGPAAFLDSFTSMISFSVPVEPLVTAFTIRRAALAAVDVVLSPWRIGLGAVVTLLAVAGTIMLARSDRRLLGLLSLLFLPYAAYHYALQSTPNLRYAIPIVPFVACLASVAILRGARQVAFLPPVAGAVAATVAAPLTLPALAAYHSPSPPYQALAAIERLDDAPHSVVVTGHYIFERYLEQIRKHEVLLPAQGARQTLVGYWQQGNQKPVVFLRQPERNTLLLFGHDRQEPLGRWRWPVPVRPFMQGERPGHVELLRLEPPRWFAESGFLVADEAGPLEDVVREKSRLRVRSSPRQRAFALSGFLHGAKAADVVLTLDGRRSTWKVGEQFALHTMIDPVADSETYLPLSVEASAPAVFTDVWMEPSDRAFIRPSQGFYTAERDEDTELFRWIAPHAVASAYLPVSKGRLTIEGWIPDTYRQPLALSFEWNGRPLASLNVDGPRFRVEQDVAGSPGEPWGELAITASQSFVPHERQRNGDRRTLAVRIYRLTLDLSK